MSDIKQAKRWKNKLQKLADEIKPSNMELGKIDFYFRNKEKGYIEVMTFRGELKKEAGK